MTPETAELVVTSLYVGAGRRAGEAEMTLWANVLRDQPEDDVEPILRKMLATIDFGLRPPTPALFIEFQTAHRRAHDPAERRRMLLPPIPEDGSERVGGLRDVLAAAPPPVPCPTDRALAEEARPGVRPAGQVCAADDHTQCAAGPVRLVPDGPA